MGKKHKPRSGSKAFYPKKRAKKETPSFKTFPALETEEVKALNFYGYKAGMFHAISRSEAEKSIVFGQEITIPCTVIECPPLTVFGIRAYKKTTYGWKTVADLLADKFDKYLSRRIQSINRKSKKEKPKEKVNLDALKDKFDEVCLLVHTSPSLTSIGKKKPEVSELKLTGSKEAQLTFAKEKLGQKIKLSDVFKAGQFIDVKAVDKGKGFSGVVKRYGIKIHRPKAKKHRVVGSIGPWNPSTVLWTVARPGQLGYQNRTEYNKRVLKIDTDAAQVNPESGFTNYGLVKNDYLVLAGSVPGPVKRCIALREPIRKANEKRFKVGELSFVSSTMRLKKPENLKKKAAEKPAAKKEEKKEAKPVKEVKKEVKKEAVKKEAKPKEEKKAEKAAEKGEKK
jgi:large subunit ribosomal protein L3